MKAEGEWEEYKRREENTMKASRGRKGNDGGKSLRPFPIWGIRVGSIL